MARKISEITKQLSIEFTELKGYADKLGIEMKSSRGSIDDASAERLIQTVNMMHGKKNVSGEAHRNTIKAVPVMKKDAPKMTPAAKPVPKKEEKAPSAEPEVKEEVKAEVKPTAEKTESPEPKKAEEYVNAPGKPMRFKKIVDATQVKEEEKAAENAQPKKDARRDGRNDRQGKGERTERQGKSDRNARGDRSRNDRGQQDRDGRNSRGPRNDRNDKGSRGDRNDRFSKGDRNDRGPKNDKDKDQESRGSSSRPQRKTSQSDVAIETKPSSRGKSKKFFDNKDKDKDKQSRHDRREDGHVRGFKNNSYIDDTSLEKQARRKRKKVVKEEPEIEIEELLPEGAIPVSVPITVAGLAEQAEISVTNIIMALMKMGIMATINQTLDKDAIEMLSLEMGMDFVVTEEEEVEEEEGLELYEDTESDLKPRPPIITVMGHVDHGKTSLLDAIRNTNVTAGESGGITQHIGASEVVIDGKRIVFLDTPGHEAFTTMRARGAQVTDIAVLVVAADDSVKPQTVESISHARAAGVPIIVAINKMDKPGANPDRVKQDLSEHGVLVEDWGGDVISVPVSAKKGDGIKDLLEMILLQAEVLELKANPDRLALGTVIEARLDKAKGPIATLLVTNGTLKSGQSVVAGTCSGRIRVMTNFKGEAIRKAGPATAVEILGLSDVPMAGDSFNAVKDDKLAREIANQRKEKLREDVLAKNASTTLDKLFSQIQEGEAKELNLIIKGDVQGSVGAIISSLEKLETPEVKIKVIHSGVGTINESDVTLAETSNAIIIGFNVRPTTAVTNQAQSAEVEMRLYRVIYDIIDDIQDAMKGMLDPEYKEEVLGKAEVRETFKVPNVGTIAGAYVTEGKVQRNKQIRLVRDGIVIHEGLISSLKRYKDDAKEVVSGYECGLGIEKYNDIKPGDIIECFHMVEIER